jgi:diacylglycerol kinase family enzyme
MGRVVLERQGYSYRVRSLLLIANPAASRFTGGLHRAVVAKLSRSYEVETAWPTSAGGVEARALQAAHEGVDIVVAMGGDGVVHHVVNGIAGTDATLGIIPAGTTNVLARILGIPSRPARAASYLASRPPAVRTTLARISLESRGDTTVRFATFATGLGFDAEVVRLSNLEPYRKYWFGGVHYARSAASVVLSRENRLPPMMRVESGQRAVDAAAVLVQIHDPYTFFGRFPLRVSTTPHDGLAVMLVERLTLLNVPAILLSAVSGRDLDRIRGVHVWRDVSEIQVWSDPTSPLQADGESLGEAGVVRFSALPQGLRVIAPIGA